MSEFFHFTRPAQEFGFPKIKSEWNQSESTSDGDEHSWFYKRPYKCAVRKKQVADILWPGLNVCLISDRTLQLFEAAGLTGFETHPADVRFMFPHDPGESKYWQLIVTGWGGVAPPRSGIQQISDPQELGRLTYSPCSEPEAIVDRGQWDGSDFFVVWPLPNYFWVTSRAAEVLLANRIKRCRLIPPGEVSFGTIHVFGIGFSPGRLRHYFTDTRAKQIGEPLGIY